MNTFSIGDTSSLSKLPLILLVAMVCQFRNISKTPTTTPIQQRVPRIGLIRNIHDRLSWNIQLMETWLRRLD